MLQQHPPIVQPSIRFVEVAEDKGPTPFAFGGLPQLPEDMPWPRAISHLGDDRGSLHFFAQIDLSALSRSMEHAGHRFEMPDFPRTGTLFVFLPLDGESMYNEVDCVVRYHPGSVAHLPERMPPDDTPMIIDRRAPGDTDTPFYENSHVVRDNPEAVSDCGRYLKRVYAQTQTALTFTQQNPKLENARIYELSQEELFELDREHALNLRKYGISADVDWSRSTGDVRRQRDELQEELGKPSEDPYPGAPQIFGIADQGMEPDSKEDVLLFQLGGFAGVDFGSIDGDYWIWINKDDLSEGKFDKVRGVMGMS